MLMTALTRDVLARRRTSRDWMAEGFIQVEENGDPLWKLHRGAWQRRRITDVRIDPSGKSLWIKLNPDAC